MNNPKKDPLIKALRKANREYAKTRGGRLEALFDERRKWVRRQTIARNTPAEWVVFRSSGGRRLGARHERSPMSPNFPATLTGLKRLLAWIDGEERK
jgi:hypothetical protein